MGAEDRERPALRLPLLRIAKTLQSSENVDFSIWSAKVGPVMLDATLALLRFLLSGFQSHSGSRLRIWRADINPQYSTDWPSNPSSSLLID